MMMVLTFIKEMGIAAPNCLRLARADIVGARTMTACLIENDKAEPIPILC
jgi:hypothetical protein